MSQTARRSERRGEGTPFLKGLVASVITAAALIAMAALFITAKDVGETAVRIISCAILMISAFVGGWICSRSTGVKGLKSGAIIGGILFLLVITFGVIASGLRFGSITIIKCVLSLLGGMTGGVVGVNGKATRKMK